MSIQELTKNENESKCVIELYQNCERGYYNNILKTLQENDFSSKTLDCAIRRCIRNYKHGYEEYRLSLNHLLKSIDINYKNPSEDSSTLIMVACETGDRSIVEFILNFNPSDNTMFPEKQLDINSQDSVGRNLIHYFIHKDIEEDDALDILNLLKQFFKKSEKDFLTLIGNVDRNGYTPLCLSLLLGWFKVSKFLLQFQATEGLFSIKINGNNFIHCAVLGRSVNCLKLILKHSSKEDLKHKSKEGLTPYEMAKKMDQGYFAKMIAHFEENCHNQHFLSLFSEKSEINVNDVLQKFQVEDYHDVIILLNQLKVNESIKTAGQGSHDLSIEWNIFLTTYYLRSEQQPGNKVLPERILSKFLTDHTEVKNNTLREFSDFFSTIRVDNTTNLEELGVLDIIYLNKMIYFYKIGDYRKTIAVIIDYIVNLVANNDMLYYKWIVYVNMTLILIDICIQLRYTKLVDTLIETLESYLFCRYQMKGDEAFCEEYSQIGEYLSKIEVLHKFTLTWDESFCAASLYRVMKNINENKIDEAMTHMKNYKRILSGCSYKEGHKIFKTLGYFCKCLKIQLLYFENSFTKCYKKLSKILKLTEVKEVHLKINKVVYKDTYNINEYVLFYYNTLGIINLKQKKYCNAEYFFKICISHYKKYYSQYDFSIKLISVYYIKYNLALCFFFQKKYDKALTTFNELIKNKCFNSNIFLWYRIGCCYLEFYIRKVKQDESLSDVMSNVLGYCGQDIKETSEVDILPDIPDDEDALSNGGDEKASKCNVGRIILQNNNVNISTEDRVNIAEAIKGFKKVLILMKDSNNLFSQCENTPELYKFYDPEKKLTNMNQIFKTHSKSTLSVVNSTYLSLMFCLSLNEQWNEILFYYNEYETSEFYKKENKDLILKLDNYKIEALFNLREYNKAIELIRNDIILSNTVDFKGSFYNRLNGVTYSDMSYKYLLTLNMIKLQLLNNNLVEVERLINGILANNSTEIPACLLNLLIYFYLIKGNTQQVFHLLKYRKILQVNKK
jgi:hypothetical protein